MITEKTIAIIPAAGKGTRLRPFTHYLPKEMMPLGDKPIIHYAVAEILSAGIKKIILITSKGKEAMVDYLLHHSQLPLNEKILVVVEQQEQKGLGDAVLTAKPFVDDDVEQLAVVAPDDVMLANGVGRALAIEQLLIKSQEDKKAMWVAVEEIKKSDSKKYGVLAIKNQLNDKVVEASLLVEKPEPESAPSSFGIIARYILPTEIFAVLQKTEKGAGGEIQLTDAMQGLLPNHKFFGVLTDVHRCDTGTVEGLFSANYFYRYRQSLPDKK